MSDNKFPKAVVDPAEFKNLPLEEIIANPLSGAIEAQAKAAMTTKKFLDSLLTGAKDDKGNKKPISVEFNVEQEIDSGTADSTGVEKRTVKFNAPLISLVPIPHINIDEVLIKFHYEIKQTTTISRETKKSADLSAKSGWLISKFADIKLEGGVSNKTTEGSVANRAGSLDVTVKASQAPMPKGLDIILTALANTIKVSPQ